jgi:signal transduction histidine kinase/CheY-like chemotaxis protein
LFTGILGGTLSGILVAGIVFLCLDHVNARAERLERLQDVAATLAEPCRRGGVEDDRFALALRAVPWADVERVEVFDSESESLTTYELGAVVRVTRAASPPLDEWPTAVRRIPGDEGTSSVAVTGNSYSLFARTVRLGLVLLALLACALPFAYAAFRRTYHHFRELVFDLTHVANVISTRRDYSIRAVRRGDEEMGLLVDTINHMITQIELSEGQLRLEVERAEAASVAKAQFLATMSHEIRTPINGVLGMVQLLMDTRLSAEQREFSGTILHSAEGLLAIVNDILDFSKIDAGRVRLEDTPFRLSEVLKASLEPVSIVASRKGVELCCDVDSRVPGALRGDSTRLRQVLLNLVGNAIKFTERGSVVLRVRAVDDAPDRPALCFEVEDTGIGITPEGMKHLFLPFTQVEASHNRKYGGTGLGLAIAKQIVEAMGGELFVRSKEGEGSTFGFTVRLSSVEPEAQAPRQTQGLRILLADPGAVGRSILGKALEPNEVVAVADACAVLLALKDEPASRSEPASEPAPAHGGFDLLILDIEVIDELHRTGRRLPAVPTIVIAPLQCLAQAHSYVREGCGALVCKPVRRDNLLWCMHELLRSSAPPAPLPAVSDPGAEAHGAGELLQMRVLVAEDNSVNQRIIARFLEKLGLSCDLVPNGMEAVEAYSRGGYQLVLMDIQMPVMDGLEATRAIRTMERERSLSPTRIVAMTANAMPEDRRATREAGCNDHLAKPLRWEELREYLASVEATHVDERRAQVASQLRAKPAALLLRSDLGDGRSSRPGAEPGRATRRA